MSEEKVDPDAKGDLHEGFNVGQETEFAAGHAVVNQWPDEDKVPGFRSAITEGW